MVSLRTFSLSILACCIALPCFAEKPGVVIANSPSKELKRSAHRLRIPVEQLKNAREVLEEAADLIPRIDPYPVEQLSYLLQTCEQVNRPKAKPMLESFLRQLRSQAADCPSFACYARVTSTAVGLMQSKFDYEKTLQQLRDWPKPKDTFAEAAGPFLDNMEIQVKRGAMFQLTNSDPEKALELYSEMAGADPNGISASAQIAQALMSTGKSEEARTLIDQTIGRFDQNTSDPRVIQDYENFIRVAGMNLDSGRAATAMNQLITALQKQTDSTPCSATLQSGETSVVLSCSESRILNLLRGYPVRPDFTLKTLDSLPGLKSKLEAIGGVDSLYGSGMYGSAPVTILQGSAEERAAVLNQSAGGVSVGTPPVNLGQLIQQLEDKTESDPALVRGKLKDLDFNTLVNFASTASYRDPDLASFAVEMAKNRLAEVEPLEKRAMMLQVLIRTARHVDGEVDPGLFRTGFAIADQLKQELSENCADPQSATGLPTGRHDCNGPDLLEAFLVSELSRDHFDSAADYVRSIDDKRFKLTCFIQIIQAQIQLNY